MQYSSHLDQDLDELLINPKRHPIVFQHLDAFISHLSYDGNLIGIRSREIYIRSISDFLIWSNKRYVKDQDDLGSLKEKAEKEKFEKSIKAAVKYMKTYKSLMIYMKQKKIIHKGFPIK